VTANQLSGNYLCQSFHANLIDLGVIHGQYTGPFHRISHTIDGRAVYINESIQNKTKGVFGYCKLESRWTFITSDDPSRLSRNDVCTNFLLGSSDDGGMIFDPTDTETEEWLFYGKGVPVGVPSTFELVCRF